MWVIAQQPELAQHGPRHGPLVGTCRLGRTTRKLLLLCLHTSAAACIAAGGRIARRPRACGVHWHAAP